jgi:hypothetical protein
MDGEKRKERFQDLMQLLVPHFCRVLPCVVQHVTKSRGRHCEDIELVAYLANAAGPVPLVLDLRIAHDRFGSSSYPSLNGHLYYPNDIDKSLHEAAADEVRKYRADYNNNQPSAVSFMPAISSTSGRLQAILKAKVGSNLAKAAALCILLNVDGMPLTSKTHFGF